MTSKKTAKPEVYARVLAGNRARQKTLTGKANHLKANNAYRKRHRNKTIARDAVAYAIRLGKLAKQECEVCGASEAHAHHDDYSRPLDIRWLCEKHHKEHHAHHKQAHALVRQLLREAA